MEQEIQKKGEVILYHPSETIKLEVRLENETVWLNRQQLALLFDRDVKTIGKHINNALKEELNPTIANFATVENDKCLVPQVVAKFATTANDGKVYQMEYYNLDMILSVGYRVKSYKGVQFRAWANSILKEYLLKGYSVNQHLVALQEKIDNRFAQVEQRLDEHDEQIAFFIRTNQPPIEGVFYEGQVLDARDFAETLIKSAQKEVLLIDNYIDARTFEILEVRNKSVSAAIYVERVGSGLRTLQQVSAQQTGRQIELRETPQRIHDRFLIIDDVVYHLGASLNELGRRIFAFSKMSIRKEQIL